MKTTYKTGIAVAVLAIALSACLPDSDSKADTTTHENHSQVNTVETDAHSGHEHGEHSADETENGPGHGEEENHVELSPELAKEAGIETGVATYGPLSEILSLPTEIKFDTDRIARVSPKVGGIIERLDAQEGDEVKRGETLAVIRSQELAGLKAEYLQTRAEEQLAQSTFEREKNLWEKKITAEADYQAANAAFRAAIARREATENKLHAVGISDRTLAKLDKSKDGTLAIAYLSAPFSGTIIRRSVTLGQTVASGDASADPMFIIVDDSVLWGDVAVYKKDLFRLKEGQSVDLTYDDGRIAASGQIDLILPVIDETSRTATARVIVSNADKLLRPGQFVTAQISLDEQRDVLRVPSDAVQLVEDKMSVFVPTDDGFAPRELTTGHESGGFVEIKSGLKPGEQFVTKGAFTLKAQLEKDAFGDGHNH